MRWALALAALAPLLGCSPLPPPARPSARDYPGALVDSAALPDGLFLRQRIKAHFGAREMSFSAVVQTDQGVLSLLALTPYGSRAFLIEQRGQSVRLTKYVDRELPFPPRFILLDVHRTLFLGLSTTRLADGAHSAERDGERVVERWHNGALLERTFTRVDGKPAGNIRVTYRGDRVGAVARRQIELDNGWFGYRLSIQTLSD